MTCWKLTQLGISRVIITENVQQMATTSFQSQVLWSKFCFILLFVRGCHGVG
jgi:hypothetical protein